MKINKQIICGLTALILFKGNVTAQPSGENHAVTVQNYFNTNDTGLQSGGVKMITIQTKNNAYQVWTKRFGNNPKIKVLLLHGGPGATHEYLECFESFFPKEGIEFYEYDQLGSVYSDQPKDTSLWNVNRYVEEVEQVRKTLGLNKSNFFLLGHSWGGMVAMEYAIKYQRNLKGLIVANMVASMQDYYPYRQSLVSQLPKAVSDTLRVYEQHGRTAEATYQQLYFKEFFSRHNLRLPPDKIPESFGRAFGKNFNGELYSYLFGNGISPDVTIGHWSVKEQLKNIAIPTLMIGAKYDEMNPDKIKEASGMLQKGSFLYCPNGSHFSMYDDQQVFMKGIIKFLISH